MSQLLTGHARSVRVFVAALLLAAAGCRSTPSPDKPSASLRGGELTASIRTEPRNFARFGPPESTTYLVALLTHAGLIRIDRVTDDERQTARDIIVAGAAFALFLAVMGLWTSATYTFRVKELNKYQRQIDPAVSQALQGMEPATISALLARCEVPQSHNLR